MWIRYAKRGVAPVLWVFTSLNGAKTRRAKFLKNYNLTESSLRVALAEVLICYLYASGG